VDTERLAASLDVTLASHGVCPACLCEVAWDREHGDERAQRRTYAEFAPNLWLEGLGETVRRALVVAAHDGVPGAAAALTDLEARGLRSGIFRAVVNRLADQLARETQRAFDASLN
jgi:hypothetical protein